GLVSRQILPPQGRQRPGERPLHRLSIAPHHLFLASTPTTTASAAIRRLQWDLSTAQNARQDDASEAEGVSGTTTSKYQGWNLECCCSACFGCGEGIAGLVWTGREGERG